VAVALVKHVTQVTVGHHMDCFSAY